MNPNMNLANMNPMGGGPAGGAPIPMMNNGVVNPQAQAAAAAAAARQQQQQQQQQHVNESQRGVLNTYIYEYFIRYGMYDCARTMLSSDQQVNVHKDGANRNRGENSNAVNGVGDDAMDTDSKDDLDAKLPADLPPPKLPMPASDTSFLYEWFCLFWDIYNAQRTKAGNGTLQQYVAHTQQQSRLKQNQQQDLLRQIRPEMAQQPYMMRMQNGAMSMGMNKNTLARAAMANNQNNPQMMLQQAKQNQMQRDPSSMDVNRDRPSSPASGENAPSPSKRQRVDNAPFNPNQPGGMMPNGRPGQGMPVPQMPGGPNAAAAHQMLAANGINPGHLGQQQLQQFVNSPPAAQQKSIATYSQHLQHHHGNQMNNKQIPNPGGPQGQGSPMMPQAPDSTTLNTYYNPGGEMGGPGGLRPGPGGAQAPGGSNHALQDYQMQLMLLEQQNKKRLMMARQEQDIGGLPRDGATPGPGGPGGPVGPNGQPFPETSPQTMRSGASPNPAEQMKRGTPQMNNSGIPSPVPEGGPQSRGSPNPGMNFMGNADPNMAPHFFNKGDANMAAQAQMNGMRPPSSHPGQPFNGQMNGQQIMAARQAGQAGQANPQQWQQGPNGQMMPQGMQQNPQVQGTPQQRSMPPPSAPAAAAAANANNRTTASPQQAAAAPPTPNQGNKAAPKKKKGEAAKDKRANQKKANQNLNNASATPSAENNGDTDSAAPATPMTPVNPGNFNKGQNNGSAPNSQAGAATAVPAPAPAPAAAAPVPPQGHNDPNQNGMGMDNFGMEFGPLDTNNMLQSGDVLNDFDFDSFLHDGDADNPPFDFNGAFSSEINAD